MSNKRVIILSNRMTVDCHDRLRGIERHLDTQPGWDARFVVRTSEMTATTVQEAVRRGVDGFLVDLSVGEAVLDALAQVKVPVVTIDVREHTLCNGRSNVRTVCCDDEGVAITAATHFLGQARFHSFAFVRGGIDAPWALIRQRAFVRFLADRGIYCHLYETRGDGGERRSFANWLRRLPKPTAVMAVNDDMAARLLLFAEDIKLNVPKALAVLGSDNDELVCENARPTLSSVPPDFEEEGYRAAVLLDALMRRPETVPPDPVFVPVRPTVVRESTAAVSQAGHLVHRAQQFIEKNACRGIGVDDVARHVGVSRRLLYLRFREISGTTPFDAIRARRLEAVRRRLVTTHEPITEIAASCGFENETHLMHLFKRQYGVTMRAFRSQSGI